MNSKIHTIITEALDSAQRQFSDNTLAPKRKHRGTACTIGDCERPAWTKGMCNAHYLRSRNGYDMNAPIRHRSAGKTCRTCNTPLDSHAGWGFCMKHYKQERRNIIKKALIEALGGVCQSCGQSFPDCVFDFHHLGGKDHSMSSLVRGGYAVNTIIDEAAKCQLLCANCHRLEHFHKGDDDE